MGQIVKHTLGLHVTRLRRKIKLTEHGRGSYTSEYAGMRHAELIVEIDLDALRRALGDKALLSKRGISQLQSGAIKVRALKPIKDEIKPHVHETRCFRDGKVACGNPAPGESIWEEPSTQTRRYVGQ